MKTRRLLFFSVVFSVSAFCVSVAHSQPPKQNRSLESAQKFIRARDANGDGTLSLEEFPGKNRRLFDRIDRDGDGKITLQEDTAFRESRRSDGGSTQQRTESSDGITIRRDLVYADVGGRKLKLDLYLPRSSSNDSAKPLPVIVWIHGGGWKGGRKGTGGRARGVERRGYALVDVEYRLSGEAIFPAQVQDCKAAIRWIRANAKRFGLNPDRIGVMGSSAGGHLAAFLGTTGESDEFDTDANADHPSRVQAVCDLWGPTDLLQMDDHRIPGSKLVHNAANSPESLLVGGPIQNEPFRSLAVKANPITHVRSQRLPPFLIIHGDNDLLVPPHQSELLHQALKQNGTETTLQLVKNGDHGLRQGELSNGELLDLAVGFFDTHLK